LRKLKKSLLWNIMEINCNGCVVCVEERSFFIKTATRMPKQSRNSQNQILRLFSYNVENENDFNIHPNNLCSNCVRKMRRVNTSTLEHEHQNIAEFLPHVEV